MEEKSFCAAPNGEKTEPELKKPLTESYDGKNVGFSTEGFAAVLVDGGSGKIAISGSFS